MWNEGRGVCTPLGWGVNERVACVYDVVECKHWIKCECVYNVHI